MAASRSFAASMGPGAFPYALAPSRMPEAAMAPHEALVHIPAGRVQLEGQLVIPAGATGLVAFAHGSGSSRHSPRNQLVAGVLHARGIASLLFDLLTREEDVEYGIRFDIALLTRRLTTVSGWLMKQPETKALNLGFFGASTAPPRRCRPLPR